MTKAWKEHRDVITRLYIHESRTLEDVRDIMQKQYNFKASTRSYRQQFDKWHLSKYNCKKRNSRRQVQHANGYGQQQHQHQQLQHTGTSPDLNGLSLTDEGPNSPQSVGSGSPEHDAGTEYYAPMPQTYSSSSYPHHAVPAPTPTSLEHYHWDPQERYPQDRYQQPGWRGIPDIDALLISQSDPMDPMASQQGHAHQGYPVHHPDEQEQQQQQEQSVPPRGRIASAPDNRFSPYYPGVDCRFRSGGSGGYRRQSE
ncbi:hypothetical protein CkaCkLH20_06170 [Colletotrichum karsti]|uniref:Clr5 domain-containing protein n=1 Tax=Colletotrichum karsti TaxID=1095194 RepID=A0A9P6LL60_9PEZI|nr:uncharacterized protein CkaCkLH20_06170 [Colletotrichum karsti]KAF9876227.1 hypothetical protein CkaCkLH20_06170 [Colletotrichum karsti]